LDLLARKAHLHPQRNSQANSAAAIEVIGDYADNDIFNPSIILQLSFEPAELVQGIQEMMERGILGNQDIRECRSVGHFKGLWTL
jgi:hypothetical protein